MRCGEYESWHHTGHDGTGEALYEHLQEQNRRFWLCRKCEQQLRKKYVRALIKELRQENKEMDEDLEKQREYNSKMKETEKSGRE